MTRINPKTLTNTELIGAVNALIGVYEKATGDPVYLETASIFRELLKRYCGVLNTLERISSE